MQAGSDSPQPSLLPTYAVDTFGLPAELGRSVWRAITDSTFQLEGRAGADRGHRVRTQLWFLQDMLISAFKAEANVVHRTEALARSDPAPVVKVRLYRAGYSEIIDGDERRTIGPGAIHVIDHNRPHRQVSADHEQVTLLAPYHAIGYDPARYPVCFSIGFETLRGQLLRAGLETVFDGIAAVTKAEAPALAAALGGMLRGTLAGGAESDHGETARRARVAALKRRIDDNLADPAFDIDRLLRDFGASRATVYRDFAEHGGLRHYVFERRLHRAYRLLAEAHSAERGIVQMVASRCGFVSLNHFSRRFREMHGQSPSQVLGQWCPPAQGPPRGEVPAHPGMPHEADIAALRWAYLRFR